MATSMAIIYALYDQEVKLARLRFHWSVLHIINLPRFLMTGHIEAPKTFTSIS